MIADTTARAIMRAQALKIDELRGYLDQMVERNRQLSIENYHLRSGGSLARVVPVRVDPIEAAVAEAAQVGTL